MTPIEDKHEDITEQEQAFERLHPNAVWGFRLSQLLPLIGLTVPALLIARPLLARETGATVAWLAFGVLFLLLAIWSWRFARRRFEAVRLRIDDLGLTICRGVIWHSETYVARSRVQHTDIQRGPLDRRLGLADLLVQTAGTAMATVRLGGLSDERARALRDALLEGHDQQF